MQNYKKKGKKCYTENEVIGMLEFLIDSTFVDFGGHIFQQIIAIPMGTTVPLPCRSFPMFL
jgi:hypothetical protein